MLPSWLKEEQIEGKNKDKTVEVDGQTQLDRNQFELEKKKLFDRIKSYKDNKSHE
jgi:replication initiation and membrane attachment protein